MRFLFRPLAPAKKPHAQIAPGTIWRHARFIRETGSQFSNKA
jgi:hypothetical protein